MARDPFRQTSLIVPDMYEGARLVNPRPGSYERLANRLMEEMDKRSFDVNAFAYLLTTYPEPVQDVLFAFVVAIMNAWAGRKESRSDAEFNRMMDAKFVIEQIILKRGNTNP
ncbi:hypothetical protein SEA_DAUBENSKI_250 [Streptomyces phage Daubenski]|uniref:Uncharacterized protein n=1 Tax=Streptomyces phage Daubenski TaxID=2653725 RepID=A0A5Q2WJ02_9CAUD|nr:hypothetical protein KNU80_gp006 [Streptomyces phage Daubenski]YP_010104974.1 hypothetical protein KNU80_gp055 [Streptomyces phage Daubenski]QGH76317.1 hypothetical protein SEA_DAUBENSKI_6 [Streptomyces phage Daubenski]QGH76515.1 hypothetical protein SEA_DAUBENSKI_250 [Streptomyces phage Daubenski]